MGNLNVTRWRRGPKGPTSEKDQVVKAHSEQLLLLGAVTPLLGRCVTNEELIWVLAVQHNVKWRYVRDEFVEDRLTLDSDGGEDGGPSTEEEEAFLQQRQARKVVQVLAKEMNEQVRAMRREEDVASLLRAVRFHVLTGTDGHPTYHLRGDPWRAEAEDELVSRFWFAETERCDGVDFFVSHAWEEDGDAKMMQGPDVDIAMEFGARKATAFQNVCRTVKELRGLDTYEGLTFWMDKVCIPQFDVELKQRCIRNLELFLARSDGLIVLMNPKYLTRLWCVFEWTVFLAMHRPEDIFVNVRSFFWKDNRDIFVQHIRDAGVKSCECRVQFDRTILEAKVNELYLSVAHFERFLKFSLCALIAKDFLSYVDLIKTDLDLFVNPWIDLARELGFQQLADALADFNVVQIYEDNQCNDTLYQGHLKQHFNRHIYPLLEQERQNACSRKGLSLKKTTATE